MRLAANRPMFNTKTNNRPRHNQPTRLSRRLASCLSLILLLGPLSAMTRAQEPTHAGPDCRAEQLSHQQDGILRLEEQAATAWHSNQTEQAVQTIGQMLRAIEAIEDADLKTYLFAEWAIPAKRYGVAFNIVHTMVSPEEKTDALYRLVKHFKRTGQQTLFLETLAAAFETAQTIENSSKDPVTIPIVTTSSPRNYFLANIALDYARTGYVNEATAVAQTIKEKARREPLVQRIQCYLPTAG